MVTKQHPINLHNNYNDQQLWNGAKADNQEMFKTLYCRYVIQLSNQAYKLLADEELTKDLVQEVFLNLYVKRKELAADINVGAYLTAIVKNKSLNALRDLHLQNKHHTAAGGIRLAEEIKSPFERTELRMQLNQSISTLTGKCKQVFFLRHFENKSYKEISDLLDISSKTVEKHISKALQLLRKKMGNEWVR